MPAGENGILEGSGCLLYLARTEAARTDPYAFGPAHRLDTHPLQIWIPAPIRDIMGVADIVAIAWPLATYFTALCHRVFLSALRYYARRVLPSIAVENIILYPSIFSPPPQGFPHARRHRPGT